MTEEVLKKWYYDNPVKIFEGVEFDKSYSQMNYPKFEDYLKKYQGKIPDEFVYNAKYLQEHVHEGARWIQQKAFLSPEGVKMFNIEGYIKNPVLKGKTYVNPNAVKGQGLEGMKLGMEENIGQTMMLESGKVLNIKNIMKPSKKFEFIGENRMPVPSTDKIDVLMEKLGNKPSNILNMPDKISVSSEQPVSGFSNMDEMGGFKKMYGKKTVMLLEEEQPVVSRRWESKFREKPERPQRQIDFNELKSMTPGLSFSDVSIIGSMTGMKTAQQQEPILSLHTTTRLYDRLQNKNNIQRNINSQSNIQDQLISNINIQSSIQNQISVQGMRLNQIQIQKQQLQSVNINKYVQIPKPIVIKPVPPFIPGDDPFMVRTKSRKRKKSFESRMNIFELQIPTLKDLWGG